MSNLTALRQGLEQQLAAAGDSGAEEALDVSAQPISIDPELEQQPELKDAIAELAKTIRSGEDS